MFDLNDAYSLITLEEIESKVGDYELWRYYCSNFRDINRSFCSELYDDRNPSCRIFRYNDRLIYKDFGDGGKVYYPVNYVMAKYALSYREALNVIASDFNIKKSSFKLNKNILVTTYEEKLLIKPKSKIELVKQSFNLTDYQYWYQYYITTDILNEYNVYSAEKVFLYKNDTIVTFIYSKINPIYAYGFYDYINDVENYKIYRPLESDKSFKWMFSGSKSDIEGYNQLPDKGDILILTKSLKDVMVYRLLELPSISLQGESNKLSEGLLNGLKERFKRIIVNYDNDSEGIRGTMRLHSQYNLPYFYIEEYKDISDYVKNKDLSIAKLMIDTKINEC